MKYKIYIERTIRTTQTFEAADKEEAIEKASDIYFEAMNTVPAGGGAWDDGDYAVYDERDRTVIGWG